MSDCQEFDGYKNTKGYGEVYLGGIMVLAHRLAWAMHNGADPYGKVVMHTCDNPACVNPEHLKLGTPRDNVRDMWAKGRQGHQLGLKAYRRKRKTEAFMKKLSNGKCLLRSPKL